MTVRLQRSHLYRAEYSRTLSLRLAEDKESTVELLPDTGGYTLVNVYQFGSEELLVKSMGNEEYHLHLDSGEIVTENISVRHQGERRQAHTGSFIGAFDWDEGRRWRFIPSSERAEIEVNEHAEP